MTRTAHPERADLNRLRALRARAQRRGLAVDTSRRAISLNHLGGHLIRDVATNTVIHGSRFDLTLDEAEARVAEIAAAFDAKRVGSSRRAS